MDEQLNFPPGRQQGIDHHMAEWGVAVVSLRDCLVSRWARIRHGSDSKGQHGYYCSVELLVTLWRLLMCTPLGYSVLQNMSIIENRDSIWTFRELLCV